MKKLLPLLLVILSAFAFSASAQTETKPGPAEQKLLDSLCNALNKLDLSAVKTKQQATELFMNTFSSYADQLIDVATEKGVNPADQPAMRTVGQSIGISLVKQKCQGFIKLSMIMAGQQNEQETGSKTITGTFKRVDVKGFNYIVISTPGGEQSFLWLRQFPGSEKFMTGAATKFAGKKLTITSEEIEVYLPTAKGYYKVKEIKGIDIL
ncbi:hypothetical protein IM792_05720 [Mucilaginibacter sp. JRF]|uniref:hypothetical protein n=1 Tax=Mucilaginibacter sp. JRF TaxID=2780088 RepID=UPI00187F8BEE|nr:hypothetical protein [Mucilaginibacter sp. JRF]MBE9583939.1 hypothetical protein [Mucilaginibacter sp. JRF]